MPYVYRYIDLTKQEVCYIGKVKGNSDAYVNSLEKRDAQHRYEEWYKKIGEENLLLQYIECESHTDADIMETWLINYYCQTGQLTNIAKTGWGKSNFDMSFMFGKWKNHGQNRGDMKEQVFQTTQHLAEQLLKYTDVLENDLESNLNRFCDEMRRLQKRVMKCDRISRIDMQDDFMRGSKKDNKEGETEISGESKSKRHKVYGLGDMFTMRICPVCGKDFIIQDAGTYAYQKQVDGRHLNYCSWGCMRKHLRELGKIQ